MNADGFDIVIPTVGRPALARLLTAVGDEVCDRGVSVLVVDDRPDPRRPLPGVDIGGTTGPRVRVVQGRCSGPAAARNVGWRHSEAPWIVFLDDDVVPQPGWHAALQDDIAAAGADVAGVQGRIIVPLPDGRRPTDWERNVAGLAAARWATADMAYRRDALAAVGGFDERFRRAYREDADIALRVRAAGWRLARGIRRTHHPVGPAGRWVSVRLQAGNADDIMMRALHGRSWRTRADVPRGTRRSHLTGSAAALAAGALAVAGRPRAAALAGAVWAGVTARFALARIVPGPRDRAEVATMVLTSIAIPFAATWHTLRGIAVLHRRLGDRTAAPRPPSGTRPRAVLFDRDGTLVVDVPYNTAAERVRLMPGAVRALDRLRRAGVATAVVSNQSGVGRGLITPSQLQAVNARIDSLLGGLGPWMVCPHTPEAECECRKPQPGLVLAAARELGIPPGECAVVGDIASDIDAARAAGARAVLVPTARTRRDEVATAPEVAIDLLAAVELLLGEAPR